MDSKRIVVTGYGVVSSVGIGRKDFKEALQKGSSGISPIEAFDTEGYQLTNAAEVKELKGLKEAYSDLIGKMGRTSCFSVLAASEAIDVAQLSTAMLNEANCGVMIGTTNGESQEVDEIVKSSIPDQSIELTKSNWQHAQAHSIHLSVARELKIHGESMTIGTACAAGNYAIGYACDVISSGDADVMLCGGADSVCRMNFTSFYRLGAIAQDKCRPFDVNRTGILTGEGAGMLVLESLEHATARGATIYAEVLGYGTNCDAAHMVAPNKDSIARCIETAHQRAGIDSSEVDFISAHGTGTKTNDVIETKAIKKVFGDQAPPTISIKSMLGHTMGAASALGAIACIIAMEESFIPPTINFEEADPECTLDCVPNQYRAANLSIVENHGFAFGGNNAILILKNGKLVNHTTISRSI